MTYTSGSKKNTCQVTLSYYTLLSARGCSKNYTTRKIKHPTSIKQPRAQVLRASDTLHIQPGVSLWGSPGGKLHLRLQPTVRPQHQEGVLKCESAERERRVSEAPAESPRLKSGTSCLHFASECLPAVTGVMFRRGRPCLFKWLRMFMHQHNPSS